MEKSEAVKYDNQRSNQSKNQRSNQSVKPKDKTIKQRILKNVLVLMGVCILAVLFLTIIGRFTDLHPDAYRDLVRSIVFGYGIYLLIYGGYHGVYKKIPYSTGTRKKSQPKEKVKMASAAKKETPLEAICVTFTVITVINSLMMLTGYDIPKEGTFAYIHMMTRVGIISGFIGIWMWKDVLDTAKNFRFHKIKTFYQVAHQRILRSAAIVFTLLTVVYCITMIALQSILNPAGGAFFYQSLLGMLVLITLSLSALRLFRRAD